MHRGAAICMGLAVGLLGLGEKVAAEPLFAEVTLNGQAANDLIEFDQEGTNLRARAGALRTLGLALKTDNDAEVIDLSTVAGLSYKVDPADQAVSITAETKILTSNQLAAPSQPYRRPDRAAWGAVVNYSAYATGSNRGGTNGSLIAETRVFGPRGVFTQSVLGQKAANDTYSGVRRLQSAFIIDKPDSARRVTVGDFVSSSLSWTTPVRAAGISYSTDFSLRPDMVVQPLPTVKGAAATPSTVDLYVDGVRRFTSKTAPGPFTVDSTPVMDGRGEISVVVTDAVGRQTVQNLTFYAANELLSPGRSSFAVEGGFLREGFATDNDRYTDGFATALARYGLNDHITVEGHATVTGDVRTAGLGVVAKAGEAALFAAAFNASSSDNGTGGKVVLSAQRQTGAYSVFANYEQATSNYRDTTWQLDDGRLRRALQVGAAMRTNNWGSVSASYNLIETGRSKLRVTGLNWSRGFGPLNVFVNALRTHDDRSSTVVSVGFTTLLNHERSLSGSATSSGGRSRFTSRVSSASPLPYGWGWDASAETGTGPYDKTRLEGEVRRTTSVGEAGVGLAHQGSTTYGQVYGSGSLVLIGGRVRAAARVGDSFALIQTGEPNIGIVLENNPVGVTDKHGDLLAVQIPNNGAVQVSIVPESVPLDHDFVIQERTIHPPRWMGVVAKMPVTRVQAATLTIVDPTGTPLPVGAEVLLNGRAAGRLGFDGEIYLRGMQHQNTIDVIDEAGSCRLEATYVPQTDAVTRIGPLPCALAPDRELPGDHPRYAGDSPGGELLGADASAELGGLQSLEGHADRLDEHRVHRGEVHVQRSRLHRLWVQYRNPLRWFGRRQSQDDARGRH